MSWYAVYTKSHFENKVHLGLLKKALPVFLPKISVWSSRKDRKKKIDVPLFPGYIFVEMAAPDSRTVLDVLRTSGVVRILGDMEDGTPRPVPEREIEAIMKLVSSKAEIQQTQYPQEGEGAMIVDGPFQGIQGHVVKTDFTKEEFVISFEFLNRYVSVKLDGYEIRKI
jgi:transcription termination/antitermination protein NusG